MEAIEHVCALGYSHNQALSLALAANRLLTEIALRAPDHEEIRRMLDFMKAQSVPGSLPAEDIGWREYRDRDALFNGTCEPGLRDWLIARYQHLAKHRLL